MNKEDFWKSKDLVKTIEFLKDIDSINNKPITLCTQCIFYLKSHMWKEKTKLNVRAHDSCYKELIRTMLQIRKREKEYDQ